VVGYRKEIQHGGFEDEGEAERVPFKNELVRIFGTHLGFNYDITFVN